MTVTGQTFTYPQEMVLILLIAQLTIANYWLDQTGFWDVQTISEYTPPVPPKPATTSFPENSLFGAYQTVFHSIVKVSYYMPVRLDGFPRSRV
jgi:hypothetical protein